MFKSLFIFGGLLPSLLSPLPSRALSNSPTLEVGDIYNVSIQCQGTFDDSTSSDFENTQVFSLYDIDDNGTDCIKILTNTFYFDSPYECHIQYNTGDFSFDFSEFTHTFIYSRNYGYQTFDILTLDNSSDDDDYVVQINFPTQYDSIIINYSFNIEILDTNFQFSENSLPYLTKISSQGYNPPQKSNLYTYFYDFYYSLFSNDTLASVTNSLNIPFDSWICHTLTIITLLSFIFILFLFLRWLFKLVGNLIMLRG